MRWSSRVPIGVRIAAVAAMGVVAAAAVIRLAAVPASRQGPARAAVPAAAAAPTPAPAATPAAGADPVRLVIPVIGLSAPVEPVGVTPQRNMDVPKDLRDVGWYEGGPRPGEPGDAVIDGHLDWYTGPGIFARLQRVRPGDAVNVVQAGGATVRFQVVSSVPYPVTRPPAGLFATSGPPRLTLITCAGPWDGAEYTERLLVDAVPVPAAGVPA